MISYQTLRITQGRGTFNKNVQCVESFCSYILERLIRDLNY